MTEEELKEFKNYNDEFPMLICWTVDYLDNFLYIESRKPSGANQRKDMLINLLPRYIELRKKYETI